VQDNVKRLLAYSAIAHAGYALLGILANSPQGVAALVYYVVTYGLTTVGAFGVVAVVEQAAGDSKLGDFSGLSRRAPVVSLCMLIFMLSLAGIPPLAGFFGKFYVFVAVVKSGAPQLGLLWLVVLAIAMSAVSLYYYLQVLKRIYIADAAAGAQRIAVPCLTQVTLAVLALGVTLLGVFPGWSVGWIERAMASITH
jgi:NADH-quinone oxidoreductase subunit N